MKLKSYDLDFREINPLIEGIHPSIVGADINWQIRFAKWSDEPDQFNMGVFLTITFLSKEKENIYQCVSADKRIIESKQKPALDGLKEFVDISATNLPTLYNVKKPAELILLPEWAGTQPEVLYGFLEASLKKYK